MLDDVMDFTTKRPAVQFKLDGDVFYGVSDVAAELMMGFSDKAKVLGAEDTPPSERIAVVKELISLLLTTESSELFIRRLSSKDKPIGVGVFTRIVQWLLEQYSLRPTMPDSDSSTGSGNQESGTTSTGLTSVAV